jgi:hypothetical protein
VFEYNKYRLDVVGPVFAENILVIYIPMVELRIRQTGQQPNPPVTYKLPTESAEDMREAFCIYYK